MFAAVADISTAADYDCMKEGVKGWMGWDGIGQFSMGWAQIRTGLVLLATP